MFCVCVCGGGSVYPRHDCNCCDFAKWWTFFDILTWVFVLIIFCEKDTSFTCAVHRILLCLSTCIGN